MSKLTVIVVITMALVVTTAAQKSIYNKPYEQWTLDEAWRILTSSPWAQMDADLRTSGISYALEVRLHSSGEAITHRS
jgi:hypothetical protein